MVAVVPVKDLSQAKQRLAGLLDAEQRRALYQAMLRDVLAALAGAEHLAGVLMITRDADAIALAGEHGMDVLREPSNDGHTAASTRGARALAERGVSGMLQVPGDLPLLRAEDIDHLISVHGPAPAVTIAPSRDRDGSNAVASSPPELLPLRFGENSFYPHMQRARRAGASPRTVDRDGFAYDVDTPEDLLAVLPRLAGTHTGAHLESSGLAHQLRRHKKGSGWK